MSPQRPHPLARRLRTDGAGLPLRFLATLVLAVAAAWAVTSGSAFAQGRGQAGGQTDAARPGAAETRASLMTEEVSLAQFTTAVENREPIDAINFLSVRTTRILFFTDLRGLAGETIIHRWLHEARVLAEVPFELRSERARVWSSKALDPDRLGDWTVEVVKGDGEVIAAESFTYQRD